MSNLGESGPTGSKAMISSEVEDRLIWFMMLATRLLRRLQKVLPRGRVFIMETRYKDADEYIRLGKEGIHPTFGNEGYSGGFIHPEMYSGTRL